jgi:hypothetical protein
LCEQYGIRDIDRCEEFGVTQEQRDICSISQTDYNRDADYRQSPANQTPEDDSAAGTSPAGQEAPNDTPLDDEDNTPPAELENAEGVGP